MPVRYSVNEIRRTTEEAIKKTEHFKNITFMIEDAAAKGLCEVKVSEISMEEGSLLRNYGFHIKFDTNNANGHFISWLFEENKNV